MNAKGQAVGAADEYAFLREKDGSIVFFSVPDNNDAVPMAIDRGGDIAGFAFPRMRRYRLRDRLRAQG